MNKDKVTVFIENISNQLNNNVFRKVDDFLHENPEIRSTLNPAFPFPRELRIGLIEGCLAIEYVGPDQPENSSFKSTGGFYDSILDFLNIDISHLHYQSTPLQNIPGIRIFDSIEERIENMNFFLGDSIDILCSYSYEFSQGIECSSIGGIFNFMSAKNPFYISNSTIFWTDRAGNLKVKRIDFLEVWPMGDKGWGYSTNCDTLSKLILSSPIPAYDIKLHKKLNEFVEFIGDLSRSEPQITKFIENSPEILQLGLSVTDLNPQVMLEWQYPSGKPDLQPDFMPIGFDGYANILDFKLPNLKSKPIVGSSIRSHPSFEIDHALAQIDEYEEWCSQEINQQWLLKKKNIKVQHPKKYLIIGHSQNFSPEDRQKLRKRRDAIIMTYDELISMARFQLYRVK
jgi:hypothetical protein